MKNEFSVKKINNKVEIEDMEINASDPCKAFWLENGKTGQYDCNYDCGIFNNSPEMSTAY